MPKTLLKFMTLMDYLAAVVSGGTTVYYLIKGNYLFAGLWFAGTLLSAYLAFKQPAKHVMNKIKAKHMRRAISTASHG